MQVNKDYNSYNDLFQKMPNQTYETHSSNENSSSLNQNSETKDNRKQYFLFEEEKVGDRNNLDSK